MINPIKMVRYLLVLFIMVFAELVFSQGHEPKVILVTLDGLRWQELFGGANDSMMENSALTPNKDLVIKKFSASDRESARRNLFPFFWSTIAQQGVLLGNHWHENKVSCTNRYWFSYPGYNEILTGYSDPNIDSNDKKYNKHKTILEWLKGKPDFNGPVAAFASWDVFPYIINDRRSGIMVNAGFMKSTDEPLTDKEIFLNEIQDEIPSPWTTVRLDAFTHHYMMEYLKKNHPKMVYISYGETDDFAHDGRYDHYLNSAHQTDQWISELWDYLQIDPYYRGQTNLIITTDHGRGHSPMEQWKSHGTIYKGSHQIWIAAIGPHIRSLGEVKKEGHFFQSQIASTVAQIFGYEYEHPSGESGKALSEILNK